MWAWYQFLLALCHISVLVFSRPEWHKTILHVNSQMDARFFSFLTKNTLYRLCLYYLKGKYCAHANLLCWVVKGNISLEVIKTLNAVSKKCLSVCMLLSLWGPKASAKPDEPILLKVLQNLYFRSGWIHKNLFWTISKTNTRFGRKSQIVP